MKRLYEEVGEGQGYAAVGFQYKDESESNSMQDPTGMSVKE